MSLTFAISIKLFLIIFPYTIFYVLVRLVLGHWLFKLCVHCSLFVRIKKNEFSHMKDIVANNAFNVVLLRCSFSVSRFA